MSSVEKGLSQFTATRAAQERAVKDITKPSSLRDTLIDTLIDRGSDILIGSPKASRTGSYRPGVGGEVTFQKDSGEGAALDKSFEFDAAGLKKVTIDRKLVTEVKGPKPKPKYESHMLLSNGKPMAFYEKQMKAAARNAPAPKQDRLVTVQKKVLERGADGKFKETTNTVANPDTDPQLAEWRRLNKDTQDRETANRAERLNFDEARRKAKAKYPGLTPLQRYHKEVLDATRLEVRLPSAAEPAESRPRGGIFGSARED